MKYALPVLIAVVLLSGGYLLVSSGNQNSPLTKLSSLVANKQAAVTQAPVQPVTSQVKVSQAPSPTPLVVTDESLDSDLTALEKDLAELSKTEADFNKEFNDL